MSRSGSCWACGEELEASYYGRSGACPGCNKDTRVCRNCYHCDHKYNNECREHLADPIANKTDSNFCEYFKPGYPEAADTADGAKKQEADAKSAFDDLFKGKP